MNAQRDVRTVCMVEPHWNYIGLVHHKGDGQAFRRSFCKIKSLLTSQSNVINMKEETASFWGLGKLNGISPNANFWKSQNHKWILKPYWWIFLLFSKDRYICYKSLLICKGNCTQETYYRVCAWFFLLCRQLSIEFTRSYIRKCARFFISFVLQTKDIKGTSLMAPCHPVLSNPQFLLSPRNRIPPIISNKAIILTNHQDRKTNCSSSVAENMGMNQPCVNLAWYLKCQKIERMNWCND